MPIDRVVISVIIPVRNGEQTLGACLSAIRKQQGVSIAEIIVLDTASTDQSVRIATDYGAKVIHVEPAAFSHGLTRNIGALEATGDLLYFTVQDASIEGLDMLQHMSRYFDDPEVKGVFGMQAIPERGDTNPALWFKRMTEPKPEYRQFEATHFSALPPTEQWKHSSWDNVNAMYRKSALIQLPFQATNFSEDWLWARDALTKGWKLVYDPARLVWHYHHQSFGYMLRSQYIANFYFHQYFNRLPVFPAIGRMWLHRVWTISKRTSISVVGKWSWIIHNTCSLLGLLLSVMLFRLLYFLQHERGLDRGYRWLCQSIPQGKLKKNTDG